jgi:hypothetical protein
MIGMVSIYKVLKNVAIKLYSKNNPAVLDKKPCIFYIYIYVYKRILHWVLLVFGYPPDCYNFLVIGLNQISGEGFVKQIYICSFWLGF